MDADSDCPAGPRSLTIGGLDTVPRPEVEAAEPAGILDPDFVLPLACAELMVAPSTLLRLSAAARSTSRSLRSSSTIMAQSITAKKAALFFWSLGFPDEGENSASRDSKDILVRGPVVGCIACIPVSSS